RVHTFCELQEPLGQIPGADPRGRYLAEDLVAVAMTFAEEALVGIDAHGVQAAQYDFDEMIHRVTHLFGRRTVDDPNPRSGIIQCKPVLGRKGDVLLFRKAEKVERPLSSEYSVSCPNERVLFGLSVGFRQLLVPELEGQLGDLSGEVERHLVILVVYG